MKVVEFAFVGFPVEDIQVARRFYEGVLGFSAPNVLSDGSETFAWVEYEVGPHTLALTTARPNWQPSKTGEIGAGLALEVENFEEAIQNLKENGINFIGPGDGPNCRVALFCDPDGNSLAIHKRNPT